jgi:hypothetical protein
MSSGPMSDPGSDMEVTMTPAQLVDTPAGAERPVAPVLVAYPDSGPLRRRLGPLAWVALEHLALSSHRTDQGWAAPVGSATRRPVSASPRTPPPAPSRR